MDGLQKFLWPTVLFVMLYAFACVTVNIYFPAEQVESIAGEIVNDIRGQEGLEEQSSLRETQIHPFYGELFCFYLPPLRGLRK